MSQAPQLMPNTTNMPGALKPISENEGMLDGGNDALAFWGFLSVVWALCTLTRPKLQQLIGGMPANAMESHG
eukprot:1145625-Pelagomonas_calceolata.AAC.9